MDDVEKPDIHQNRRSGNVSLIKFDPQACQASSFKLQASSLRVGFHFWIVLETPANGEDQRPRYDERGQGPIVSSAPRSS